MCCCFCVILNKKKCTRCRPRGYKFENLNSFSVPYFPADATHCPRRFWLDFALFRKKLEWKYWSLGCCVQVVVYILISTKNHLQESRIEKYAGNWCFECTIESSKLMIIFCVAAAWLVIILNFNTTRQFTSHLQYCNHQNTHAFFVRKATWIKKLIFGMIRQAGIWYTQISSKNCLHAVTTLSFYSSTHCPRRFWLAVFFEKQSYKKTDK